MDERYAPHPDVPQSSLVVTGETTAGEHVDVALGICDCHDTHDFTRGRFWLRAGEQWVCPECDRTYFFNGQRIDTAEPDHI